MILRGSLRMEASSFFHLIFSPKALSSWRISDLYSLLIAESLPLFLFEAPFSPPIIGLSNFSQLDNRIISAL